MIFLSLLGPRYAAVHADGSGWTAGDRAVVAANLVLPVGVGVAVAVPLADDRRGVFVVDFDVPDDP